LPLVAGAPHRVGNLVPGTTYLERARAIGGSTGASNWTGNGSIMSI